MRNNTKGFSAVESILLLVILGLIGFVGWYVWKSGQSTNKSLDNSQQNLNNLAKQSNTATQSTEIPEGWKEYKNEEFGFAFSYPADWGEIEVNTYSPSKGAIYRISVTPNYKSISGSFILKDWEQGNGPTSDIHLGFKEYPACKDSFFHDKVVYSHKLYENESVCVRSLAIKENEPSANGATQYSVILIQWKQVKDDRYAGIGFDSNPWSLNDFSQKGLEQLYESSELSVYKDKLISLAKTLHEL